MSVDSDELLGLLDISLELDSLMVAMTFSVVNEWQVSLKSDREHGTMDDTCE
jgi:hypothetical protein